MCECAKISCIEQTRLVSRRYVDQVQCRVRARYQFLLARLSRDQVVARFLLKSCYYQITSCSIIAILSLSCLNAFGHDAKVILHTGHRAVHFFLLFTCFRVKMWVKCILFRVYKATYFYCSNFVFLFERWSNSCFKALDVFFSIYGLQISFMYVMIARISRKRFSSYMKA